MKPRLHKAQLTDEDVSIIESRWYYGPNGTHPLWFIQNESDRRDADLMLEARQTGAVSIVTNRLPFMEHGVWWEFGNMAWYCGICNAARKSWAHIMCCA